MALSLSDGKATETAHIKLDSEIACLDITPLGALRRHSTCALSADFVWQRISLTRAAGLQLPAVLAKLALFSSVDSYLIVELMYALYEIQYYSRFVSPSRTVPQGRSQTPRLSPRLAPGPWGCAPTGEHCLEFCSHLRRFSLCITDNL